MKEPQSRVKEQKEAANSKTLASIIANPKAKEQKYPQDKQRKGAEFTTALAHSARVTS